MGRHDNYGFALAAQPGESKRRPITNTNSRFIVQNGLPALGAPGASIPDGHTICRDHQDPSRISGAEIFIPVTNPIESVFATVRHRTVRMKGALSQATARLMVFKLKSRPKPNPPLDSRRHRKSAVARGTAEKDACAEGCQVQNQAASQRLTGALLDRLTHHVHILEMNGESYRLKQSKARRRRDIASADHETGKTTSAS
jgi:hypothetical protein